MGRVLFRRNQGLSPFHETDSRFRHLVVARQHDKAAVGGELLNLLFGHPALVGRSAELSAQLIVQRRAMRDGRYRRRVRAATEPVAWDTTRLDLHEGAVRTTKSRPMMAGLRITTVGSCWARWCRR